MAEVTLTKVQQHELNKNSNFSVFSQFMIMMSSPAQKRVCTFITKQAVTAASPVLAGESSALSPVLKIGFYSALYTLMGLHQDVVPLVTQLIAQSCNLPPTYFQKACYYGNLCQGFFSLCRALLTGEQDKSSFIFTLFWYDLDICFTTEFPTLQL